MDGSQNSLTCYLNHLVVVDTIYGLKINTDKTKVVWIGNLERIFLKDKLIDKYTLIWGEDEFQLLGLTFNVNLDKTISQNYENALVKLLKTALYHGITDT